MTPPSQHQHVARAAAAFSASISCGTRVRWPAGLAGNADGMDVVLDRLRAPTSSGVWNRAPISTSKPISAKAVAITLAPRSWPSWPSLATSRRGRRPCSSAKAGHVLLRCVGTRDRRHRRRHRRRRWRGSSPDGGRTPLPARTRFRPPWPAPASPRPRAPADWRRPRAALVSASSAASTLAGSREALSWASRAIWAARTLAVVDGAGSRSARSFSRADIC